jgi:hypothetical protein
MVRRLGEALKGNDTDRVHVLVKELRVQLGDRAGEPEVADQYLSVSAEARPLTRDAGRWLDPHNARPPYHYIIMRALAALVDVLPAGSAERRPIMDSLVLGLQSRNEEFTSKGVMNLETASSVLASIGLQFAGDKRFLEQTGTRRALDVFDRLFAEKYRKGDVPVGPRSWAAFLAWKLR